MTATTPDRNDERYAMGAWFDSVARAVEAYPLRAGTEAAKIIHYDRLSVMGITKAFNGAAKNGKGLSKLEQASAGRHLYTISEQTSWTASDAAGITGAAEDLGKGLEHAGGKSASDYMHERMKRLYKICKKNAVGVVVHTPRPGLIQINLTPQTRPTFTPKPRPRKMTLRM